MGGYGSGRHGRRGGRWPVERCDALPLRDLAAFAPGWSDMLAGGEVGIYPEGGARQRIGLQFTRQHGGGRRVWLVCPDCNGRCTVLWRPRRGPSERFACRTCHRLCYNSQTMSIEDRWRVMAQRLRYRAGAMPGDESSKIPTKPKWMRWHTFSALLQRADDYEVAAFHHSVASCKSLAAFMSAGSAAFSVRDARQLARIARNPRNYRPDATAEAA